VALAEAAARRGAQVKLLMGQKDFVSAQDLLALVKQHAPNFDIIFHTAAVGDYSPELKSRGKLSSRRPVVLRLETQVKILEQIKKYNPKITVIGFKAEFGLPNKLTVQSGADVTVYNDVSRPDIGFGSDDNEVTLVLPRSVYMNVEKAPKAVVAGQLLDYLCRYYHW